MAAETEAVQHGVRYIWPGNPVPHIKVCADRGHALDHMRDLAGQGVTVMDPITRPEPEWRIDPAGLHVAVRLLAEAYLDKQVDDAIVHNRLSEWLADGGPLSLAVLRAWPELLAAIEARAEAAEADDKPISDAVNKLIGRNA